MAIERGGGKKGGKRGEVIEIGTKKILRHGRIIPELANIPRVRGKGFVQSELEKEAMKQEQAKTGEQGPFTGAEKKRELVQIDGIASRIIARFGRDADTRRKLEPLRQNINQASTRDLIFIKIKLLRWDGTEKNPELYLGLAEWWQNYRKPKSPTPTER